MIKQEELFPIGRFQKTHALKGELNAYLDIDGEFLDDEYPLIMAVDGIYVPFYVEGWRTKGAATYLVKLQGVDSEEEAKKFVNSTIYVLKADVVEFTGEEDLHAIEGLVDYKVNDEDAGYIGKVVSIDDSTANVLMEVKRPDGSEIYLPLTEDLIREIDDEEKTMLMSLPDGLLTINEKKESDE